MASNYVIVDEGIKDQYHHQHHHYQQMTSPRSLRPSASSSPTSSGSGTSPKCVCAPATHAGSFKCRLHRTNSHGPHSPQAVVAAAAAAAAAAAPSPPSAAVSSAPSRTVEAQ